MGKRYLITGGAGFIGSHLAERLIREGHSLIILDDLSTGRMENLAGVITSPQVQFVRDSVENETTVALVISQCDAVFHLAAAVGVQLVVEQPVQTIRTTIRGTENILEAAYRFGRPVLITSSSEVYGKGARVPFAEDDDVLMGATRFSRWCYAYSKGIDEFLGLAYFNEYRLPVSIVRLFNTVGPRQVGMYGMVLPRFAAAAVENLPLQVYGDGNQTRCFCHVADVVDALIKVMEHPRSVGQVFNLGSDEEISINDLAAQVVALAKSSSKIEHIAFDKAYGRAFDDLPRRVPKLERIRELIGFRPVRNLEQIIRSVIEDQRKST